MNGWSTCLFRRLWTRGKLAWLHIALQRLSLQPAWCPISQVQIPAVSDGASCKPLLCSPATLLSGAGCEQAEKWRVSLWKFTCYWAQLPTWPLTGNVVKNYHSKFCERTFHILRRIPSASHLWPLEPKHKSQLRSHPQQQPGKGNYTTKRAPGSPHLISVLNHLPPNQDTKARLGFSYYFCSKSC